jgi:hypothetical protein
LKAEEQRLCPRHGCCCSARHENNCICDPAGARPRHRDSTGTVQEKTTTVAAPGPAVDTAATAEAKQDAKDAARDAAHATGTAMETAGKEIQRQTAPPKKKP